MNPSTIKTQVIGRYYRELNAVLLKPAAMQIRWKQADWQLRHAFTLAGHSRTSTPAIIVEIEYEGIKAWGEAALPPYLGESAHSAMDFLSRLQHKPIPPTLCLTDLIEQIDETEPGHTAAKAALDTALHDLCGKLIGQPLHAVWHLDQRAIPLSSFTIGIDSPEIVRQKVREAGAHPLLKIKLGRDNDRELIETIRHESQATLMVDANQGWTDKHRALDEIYWLHEQGIVLVEQPMPVAQMADQAWLCERSPLPLFADESIRRLAELDAISNSFSGINIKLMKCTGLFEAHQLIAAARQRGMQVMLGCMTESSCGISAAAQLSPLTDRNDLDGNLLIGNDCFAGSRITDGKITLGPAPGTGARPVVNIF